MKLNLSHLVSSMSGVFGRHRVADRRGPNSTILYPRTPHQPMPAPGPPDTCACESWQIADVLWVGEFEHTRQAWRDAVQRPGISGYDLWMGWHVWCFAQGLDAPATPPPSGGYSYDVARCTGGTPVPDICAGRAPPPPWTPGVPCDQCTQPNPTRLWLHVWLFDAGLLPLNGTWLLEQVEAFPCHFTHAEELWNWDLEFFLPGSNIVVLDVADLVDCSVPFEGSGGNSDNCATGEGGGWLPPPWEFCPIPPAWYEMALYRFEPMAA